METITRRRAELIALLTSRRHVEAPPVRDWRKDDPPATTVGELGPDDFNKRVVIRSGDFLGTVYGTLVGVHAHQNLVHFTCVQLLGKKLLTFRNDLETIVVDDLRHRESLR